MADVTPLKNEYGKIENFSNADTIPVINGGTSVSSFGNKGFVIGEGTNPLKTIKAIFNSSNDPTVNDDGMLFSKIRTY